jgi:hypothetical protein
MRILSSRLTLNIIILAQIVGFATAGSSVVLQQDTLDVAAEKSIAGETDLLKANLLARADSELQIRRLRSLLVAGELQEDRAIQRLERLQKQLRGQAREAD